MRNTIKLLLWLLCGWLYLLSAGVAHANKSQDYFVIKKATLSLVKAVYRLDADIVYKLTPSAASALESGVPLIVELQVEVAVDRSLVWDEKIAALKQRYRLRYSPMTRSYIVEYLNTKVHQAHTTRSEALAALGTIRDLPVIDRSLIAKETPYRLRLKVTLDLDALPMPLRVWAYLLDEWQALSSSWYEIVIRNP